MSESERVLGPGAKGDPNDPGDPTTPVDPPKPAEDLKGKELDDALDTAGLPKGGSASEKRERLAEYQGETTTEEDNR